MVKADEVPIYPLYNSTHTAYRVSPLYHGETSILDEANLSNHARRLKQALKGDTLRGVPIAYNEYTQFARSGVLQDCTWDLLGDETTWDRLHTSKEGEDNDTSTASVLRVEPGTLRGVQIQLHYERASHSALLLRDPDSDDFAIGGFTSLPLLLVRMPAALREVLVDYLSKTFDTLVTPLKLQSSFLTSSLEGLLRRLDNKVASENLSSLWKGVQIQLSFPNTSAALKNLDIAIAKDDIAGFIAHGKALQQSSKASKKLGPFALALQYYLRHHLSLDMTHSDVRVSKAIAGPFALSLDGKIKLFAPRPADEDEEASPTELAMRDLYTSLCAYAAGAEDSLAAIARSRAMRVASTGAQESDKRPLRAADGNASRSSPSKRRAKDVDGGGDEIAILGTHSSPRKRRQVSVPFEPPPPYELVDPRLIA